MPTTLITGGTGLVGKALTRLLLQKGHTVTILTREKREDLSPGVHYASWDLAAGTIDETALANADYIVHLAGAGVAAKRWTARRKREIVESRTKSSALLASSLARIPNRVKAVVSASAIGWYAPTTRKNVESEPPATDFLGETCRLWEESIAPVAALGKRLVKVRTGIVLSPEGGALPEFRKPVKFGIAAVLGDGKQIVSWIHLDDLCRIYAAAIESADWEGAFNAVAPNPVTNRALMLDIARKIKGSFFIPFRVPALVLKLALGEMSVEVLKSSNISCEKLRSKGFQFLYPTVEAALGNLL